MHSYKYYIIEQRKGRKFMELCQNPKNVSSLFAGWQETLIYSYLQGCMGECWVDQNDKPKSAQIIVTDFGFYAGIPDIELV